MSICFCVSLSLACESARACSKAVRQTWECLLRRIHVLEKLRGSPGWRSARDEWKLEMISDFAAVQSVFKAVAELALGGDLILM